MMSRFLSRKASGPTDFGSFQPQADHIGESFGPQVFAPDLHVRLGFNKKLLIFYFLLLTFHY